VTFQRLSWLLFHLDPPALSSFEIQLSIRTPVHNAINIRERPLFARRKKFEREDSLAQWRSPQKNRTCRVCGAQKSFNTQPFSTSGKGLGWIRRSLTFEALESGRHGCDFCYILVKGILAFYKQNEPPENMPRYVTLDCWPGYHCKVRVETTYNINRDTGLSIYTQKGTLIKFEPTSFRQQSPRD
jgi:hypothetical protein